jgi:hypothetical protein
MRSRPRISTLDIWSSSRGTATGPRSSAYNRLNDGRGQHRSGEPRTRGCPGRRPDPIAANTWSTYWYNGLAYANDILRGFDAFSLAHPSVAGAASLDRDNPQSDCSRRTRLAGTAAREAVPVSADVPKAVRDSATLLHRVGTERPLRAAEAAPRCRDARLLYLPNAVPLNGNDVIEVCGFRWSNFRAPATALSLRCQMSSPRVMSDS